MLSIIGAERANPYRSQADLALEKVEKSGCMLDGHFHVLNDSFEMNAEEPPVDLAQSDARLPINGFLVEGRIQALAPQQSADDRALRIEHPRTPEPIGIPPPDV